MNFPSVSQWSFAKGTGGTTPPELYLPLWWYSGSMIPVGSGATSASSSYMVVKGGTVSTSSANSGTKLCTVNSSWSPNTKFAFEACLEAVGGSGGSVYAALWDFTANAIVSASQISTTSSTYVICRSGQFTLTPGRQYGIAFWNGLSSGPQTNLTDASLIVFPS